jgi:DedD protein
MQSDQSDLELIFKKRARRRLVGAIALVLLMITLLPLLLKDRTGANAPQEIAIMMPNESRLDNIPPDFDDGAPYENVAELASPDAVDLSDKTAELENEIKINESKETIKTLADPATKAASPTAKPADTIPIKNIANQFYVQIGVFSDPQNVKKLQIKLDELGYQSVIEKLTTDTGEKTRLRTAAFTNKNEAIIALENIKDAGLTGMVISQK